MPFRSRAIIAGTEHALILFSFIVPRFFSKQSRRNQGGYRPLFNGFGLNPLYTGRYDGSIQALSKRHSSDPNVDLRRLDAQYANAMQELHRHCPDDLDAATLYAESRMDLHPFTFSRPATAWPAISRTPNMPPSKSLRTPRRCS